MSRTAKPKTGFGLRLKKLRESRLLTQEQLAHELKFASGTVSRWERERGSPQAEQLVALCEYFSVTSDHLLLGAPEKPAVASDEFHKFLATAAGRYAKQRGLVNMLTHLKYDKPLTVELYRGIVNVFRAAEEAAHDEAQPDETPKTPSKE
jgi:transcriptional regulator with XRE-family HTH domain